MKSLLQRHVIVCVIVLTCILYILPLVRCKVCDEIDVRNSIHHLNKIRNCTEITGNLTIVLIESTNSEEDYDNYVFPELKSITGSLILFKLQHLTSLGKLFPNLRVIRGLTLFMNYALVIWDLPNLREIGTYNLLYISRGYVKIAKTPKLCYANTVNWNWLGNNTLLHIQEISENCPACPERCNGHCWNNERCQVSIDNYCHPECLGCTQKNSSRHCEVCRNYDDEGVCVPYCPSNKFIQRTTNRCLTEKACLELNVPKNTTNPPKNAKHWFIYEDKCRTDCPVGTIYNESIQSCNSCGNKCDKLCSVNPLNNQNEIQKLLGCTHINGSITVTGLRTQLDLETLYENLKAIRYIRDYLIISRNDIIEDFSFLPNLTEIGGQNIDDNANKSLFVFENRNLKKLWNMDNNFKFKIRKGSIGFHDNEQLCLSEIKKFAKKAGVNYSPYDVSQYSNGVSCMSSVITNLTVIVTNINTINASLTWERKNDADDLYYTVYYTTESNSTKAFGKRDQCRQNGWDSITTTDNFTQLTRLKVYTTYYFYIAIYRVNIIDRTDIKNFTTLADDPDIPSTFTARPIDHSTIRLQWSKPLQVHGTLEKYVINVFMAPNNLEIAYQRDYCLNPHSQKGAEIDKVEEDSFFPYDQYDFGEGHDVTYPNPNCTSPEEEINIKPRNDVWLYLCDKRSYSKFGFDSCRNYYYETFVLNAEKNSTDQRFQKKRSGIRTTSIKKSSLLSRRSSYFVLDIAANETMYDIDRLEQFTTYVFYIMACNKRVDQRPLCSAVLQTWAKTLKNPSADVIPSEEVEVKVNDLDVEISWTEPRFPNVAIVSYNIRYKKDQENAQNSTICISEEKYRREKRHTIRNMLPGKYYISVRANSLAGPGEFTERKLFEIASPVTNPFWLIFTAVAVLLIAIGGLLALLHIKRKRALDGIKLITSVNPDYAATPYIEDEYELERNDVEIEKQVGFGQFGIVYIGKIISKNLPCAIKTVTETATIPERQNFLKEASIMKDFNKGPHVVKLFGVVSRGQPPLVCMELMERGDLKQYLRSLRDSSQNFTSNEIYRMAIEIADGISYLNSKKYVHRDLAARNCMVAHDRTVKIGDFGMTRDVYETDYYKKESQGILPVRWMAPESLADGVYTSDSDIWSYGIVLWEIATLAEQPYQGLINEQVLQFVVSQGKLERPSECPNLLWEIMHRCWEWNPIDRPTCFEIVEKLQDHVGQDFKLVSYYHSREGQEFLITKGSMRVNNPPALGMGAHHYEDAPTENDPLNIIGSLSHPLELPECLPPSSPQKDSSVLEVKADIHHC